MCIDFLKAIRKAAAKCLDGRNLEMFLLEVGSRFHMYTRPFFFPFACGRSALDIEFSIPCHKPSVQLEFSWTISRNSRLLTLVGSFWQRTCLLIRFRFWIFLSTPHPLSSRYSRELTSYQDCIRAFGLPQLVEKFDILRQIGNLFVVRPENIKGLLEEDLLSKVDRRVLHSCITMRADYKTEKISQYFEEEPDQEHKASPKTQNLKGFLSPSVSCLSVTSHHLLPILW